MFKKWFKYKKKEKNEKGLGYGVFVIEENGVNRICSLDHKMTEEVSGLYIDEMCRIQGDKLIEKHFEKTEEGKMKMLNLLFNTYKG